MSVGSHGWPKELIKSTLTGKVEGADKKHDGYKKSVKTMTDVTLHSQSHDILRRVSKPSSELRACFLEVHSSNICWVSDYPE
jgi:hypothetical protein